MLKCLYTIVVARSPSQNIYAEVFEVVFISLFIQKDVDMPPFIIKPSRPFKIEIRFSGKNFARIEVLQFMKLFCGMFPLAVN